MKVMVTGARGQLGYDMQKRLGELGIPFLGVDLADFDLTRQKDTMDAICAYSPDCVVHCAAYTAVDKAEAEKELCYRVNVTGTENVAKACAALKCKMVYLSTDYVFDGSGERPFPVDAVKKPLNQYGLTKSLGEDMVRQYVPRHFIVRTSWVFGSHGKNFVATMLRLGAEKEAVNVVDDQIGSPTYTRDLSILLCDMLRSEKYGVYHATNQGWCSFCSFAHTIMEYSGSACQVLPIASESYGAAAVRPHNSRLDKSCLEKAGFSPLPDWRDALIRYLAEIGRPV